MEPESEKNKKPLSLKKGEEATKDAPANKSGEVSRSEPTESATQAPTASATQTPTASATPSIAAPKKPAPKPATSKPAVDPSISVDEEAAPVGTAGIVVDALAAAAAIAFTFLIFQETLPFLK